MRTDNPTPASAGVSLTAHCPVVTRDGVRRHSLASSPSGNAFPDKQGVEPTQRQRKGTEGHRNKTHHHGKGEGRPRRRELCCHCQERGKPWCMMLCGSSPVLSPNGGDANPQPCFREKRNNPEVGLTSDVWCWAGQKNKSRVLAIPEVSDEQ